MISSGTKLEGVKVKILEYFPVFYVSEYHIIHIEKYIDIKGWMARDFVVEHYL